MSILKVKKNRPTIVEIGDMVKQIFVVVFVISMIYSFLGSNPKPIPQDGPTIGQQLRTEKDLIQPMEGDILEEERNSSQKRNVTAFLKTFTAKSHVKDSLKHYDSQFIAHGWTKKKTIDDIEVHYHKFYKGKEMFAIFYPQNYLTYSIIYEYEPNSSSRK